MGKDHTIFAKVEGHVRFRTTKDDRKIINVDPAEAAE